MQPPEPPRGDRPATTPPVSCLSPAGRSGGKMKCGLRPVASRSNPTGRACMNSRTGCARLSAGWRSYRGPSTPWSRARPRRHKTRATRSYFGDGARRRPSCGGLWEGMESLAKSMRLLESSRSTAEVPPALDRAQGVITHARLHWITVGVFSRTRRAVDGRQHQVIDMRARRDVSPDGASAVVATVIKIGAATMAAACIAAPIGAAVVGEAIVKEYGQGSHCGVHGPGDDGADRARN